MHLNEIQSHPLSNVRQNIRTVVVDFIILAGIYGMISFAHLIPFPLYKLEPMKLFLLIAILYSSRGNALLMAATIPLISTVTSGHPIFPKNLIIGVELIAFAGVLTSTALSQHKLVVKFLAALVVSKTLYYGIKALVIYSGWMSMTLFSTSLQIQLQGAFIVFAAFWIFSTLKQKSTN